MAELELFGFDNEEIKGGMYDKYKGKKNETHRCGIIYSDPKAMLAGMKVHFKERFFQCKKGKCCEICGPAKWRVGAVLIKYGTDKHGAIKKPFSYDLYPWIFSEATYVKLKGINSEFSLANHDIKISCDNEEYQHLNIIACNESIWTSKDELKTLVLDQAKPFWESVKKSIASDLSVEEINDLLGIGSSAPGADPTAAINLDQVLDKI
jgi:hypothetical protein